MKHLIAAALLFATSGSAYAQSGAIDIYGEFARAHSACLTYLNSNDDQSIRALGHHGYRLQKRGKGLSAYLESSRAIPSSRRPSMNVVTGKKIPFSALKTCQIFAAGAPHATYETLHRTSLTTFITEGFLPESSKGTQRRFTKAGSIISASGVNDRGLYKLVLSRLAK